MASCQISCSLLSYIKRKTPLLIRRSPQILLTHAHSTSNVCGGIDYGCSLTPSPGVHIGNYLGAIKPLVQLQNKGEKTFLCIADIEGLAHSSKGVQDRILSFVALVIACGIDPNKTVLYQQSQVPQQQQLLWLLQCWMAKDLIENLPNHSSVLTQAVKLGQYLSPLSHASDLLVNRTRFTPVGREKFEWIELAQICAQTLNSKNIDSVPLINSWVRDYPYDVLSLKNPSLVMSRDDSVFKNRIELLDLPETIVERCKKAVTDFESKVYHDVLQRPGVSNLIAIHSQLSGKDFDTIAEESKALETSQYKLVVAESIIEHLTPISEKYHAIVQDKEHLKSLMEVGAFKARANAENMLLEVYRVIGFNDCTVLNTSSVPQPGLNLSCQDKLIFSGIQPTGVLHLGNYFGAVKQWVEMQDEQNDIMVSIVDQHAITMPQDSAELRRSIVSMAASLIACGIDPDRCILFQQSRVSEHAQLYAILANLTLVASLSRQGHYKDKVESLKTKPNLGLFTYPVLQAADILLYNATHVPVGEDQKQHIELARNICSKFNKAYGRTFKVPKPIILDGSVARLKSLRQPSKKMSKSEKSSSSRIEILDSPDTIVEKITAAETESTKGIFYNPSEVPGISNLITLHSLVTRQTVDEIAAGNCHLSPSAYKNVVAEVLVGHISPIRQRAEKLMGNRVDIQDILEDGAKKAKARAMRTMEQIHQKLQLKL